LFAHYPCPCCKREKALRCAEHPLTFCLPTTPAAKEMYSKVLLNVENPLIICLPITPAATEVRSCSLPIAPLLFAWSLRQERLGFACLLPLQQLWPRLANCLTSSCHLPALYPCCKRGAVYGSAERPLNLCMLTKPLLQDR
jgi:hypothetical protein